MECPDAARDIKDGDQVAVDLTTGEITNLTTGRTYKAAPFPQFMQELIKAGGLVEYVKERMGAQG
jgi:3-isopropylmalate/(R)-2-methylmalate dehydratase small subunit